MAVKQTAGRDALGEFAPKFAELNDEVLFGQVWSREDKLSLRDRSLVTVVALMAQGLTDSSFRYHLTAAKNNGITRTEIAEILTHAAFYAGWPKAWAAFRMAKEVWAEESAEDAKAKHQSEMVFPIGAPNDGFAQYFSGKSYLAPPVHRTGWHRERSVSLCWGYDAPALPATRQILSGLPRCFSRQGWPGSWRSLSHFCWSYFATAPFLLSGGHLFILQKAKTSL